MTEDAVDRVGTSEQRAPNRVLEGGAGQRRMYWIPRLASVPIYPRHGTTSAGPAGASLTFQLMGETACGFGSPGDYNTPNSLLLRATDPLPSRKPARPRSLSPAPLILPTALMSARSGYSTRHNDITSVRR